MKRLSLLFLLFLYVIASPAQAIKIIGMFDTNDAKIGKSMAYERMIVINELKTIAGTLELYGYDMQVEEYYGANCGKSTLMRAINNLQVSNEDIVIFYYGGHGARSVSDHSDRFPQMCLGERNPENYVPASLIRNMIAKKNPKFALILTGCCNSEANISVKSIVAMSDSYTSMKGIEPENYRKLFCEQTGIVQITSSRAGEFSFCGESGSFFANVFLTALEFVGEGDIMPDWNKIAETVKSTISAKDIVCEGQVYRQHPDYEIFPSNGSGGNGGSSSVVRKNPLENDLAKLLDKSKNSQQRLNLVQQVRSSHFLGDVKVMTVGRDMKTMVDYEDADTFLRRIAMSPYITQINVVDQNNTYITVHEVRSR